MAKHKFQYIAKSYSDGSECRSTIGAEDRNAAIAAIRANGLMPTALGQILDEPTVHKRLAKKCECFSIQNKQRSIVNECQVKEIHHMERNGW